MTGRLEGALARPRLLSVIALAVLILLAWAWLLAGAGMEMRADPAGQAVMHMPSMSGHQMPTERGGGGFDHALLTFAMWWVMMVAMMLPSASPMILLHARVAAQGGRSVPVVNLSFLLGYLIVWGFFALCATALQLSLSRSGLFEPDGMALSGRIYSTAVLIMAGIYQMTPLKNACLRQCRDPARFLSLHYRPGHLGALRMGVLHGAYCVGCCWLLMALLFVGGIMNIGWIALLTLLVAAEKLLPWGRGFALVTGGALILWGMALFFWM